MKVLELFSGYGTATFALKRLGIEYELVGYSDIDKYANQIFKQNHCSDDENNKLRLGDVKKINPDDLRGVDLITGGFPCQAFSVAGNMKGEADLRGTLFYEIIRIAEAKQPKYMLLENVKGLTSKKFTTTFNKILSELRRIGYNVYWKVLNTKEYGIPQSRARVWFVCIRKDLDKPFPNGFKFPNKRKLKIFVKDILEPEVAEKYYLSEKLQERFRKYLEDKKFKEAPAISSPFGGYHDEKVCGTLGAGCGISASKTNYVLNEQKLQKDTKTRDINLALKYAQKRADEEGNPIQLDLYHLQHGEIRPLSTYIPGDSRIHRCLQAGEPKELLVMPKNNPVYDRKGFDSRTKGFREKEGITPTLSRKMGTGGNNVPMVANRVSNTITQAVGRAGHSSEELNYIENNLWSGQLRRLTPRECFRLMGFLDDEINIEGLSDTQLYKLAGNGQDINLVSLIFKEMFTKIKKLTEVNNGKL